MRQNLLNAVSIFVFSLILFTWGLGTQEVIGFESRFYLFAQEMWRNGFSWFPTTYHQPYPDYPVTSTLFIYLMATLFGALNKWVAVLPSAIMAAGTVMFTYLIGALQSKRWGFFGICFLLLTISFLKDARTVSLDMYTTFATCACFYFISAADRYQKPGLSYWIMPFLLLSFACRGPIGIVMPAGVIAIYYLLSRQFKKFLLTGLVSFFLLLIGTATLLGLAYKVNGLYFADRVFRMELAGRIDHHFLPFYYYWTSSFANYAITYPFFWLVIIGLCYETMIKKIRMQLSPLIYLIGWVMIILLGMSIPSDKKIRYILPMVPALALVCAYPFAFSLPGHYFKRLPSIFLKLLLILPIILAITFWGMLHLKQAPILLGLPNHLIFSVLGSLQIISFACYYLNRKPLRDLLITAIAVIAFIFSYIQIVEPIEIYIDRAHDFVVSMEKERGKEKARLIFYKERPDGLPIKYLINMPEPLPYPEQPMFIDNAESLARFSQKAFFVSSASYFDELPKEMASRYKIVGRDTLGHVEVIVFTNQQ